MNKKPPPTNSSKTDLYDKINVDSKLKEHLYSPLMFEGQLVSGKHTTTKLAEAIKNAKSGVIRTVTTATAATLTSAVIINQQQQQQQQNMQKQQQQVGKIAASEEYNYAMSQKSIKQWPSTSKSGTGGDEYDEYNDEEEDEEDEDDDEEEEEENYGYEDEDEEEEEEDDESHNKKKEACAKKCECSAKVLY